MAMNPMQQMLMQAQKMQRDMKKAMDALNEKEYTVSKSGMVTIPRIAPVLTSIKC